MDVCVSGVIQSIGRFIRRALEREGNILRGVRRGGARRETGSLGEELRLHINPLRTPPMDVCVSGVIQSIGRFIRRALEREGNILRGVRRGRGETGSLGEELRLHNNPLRTPPMDVCVSGVIQSIGRFIRRALEREGNILRGVRRGRGAGGNRGSGGGTTFT